MAISTLAPVATAAEIEEKAKLKRHFGRFDILFFLICTLVGVDTIGSVAHYGGEAFTWMILLAVVFFVPQAMLFAELGTAFPAEGGPYVWSRLAFGHLVGAVNNFLYWVTNPVWLGGTLTISAVTAYQTFFNHGNNLSTVAFYVFGLLFIWIGVLAAVLSFGVGKWLPTAGAIARFCLLGFFTLSVILYAGKHGFHGFGGSGFKPSYAGFIGLVGILMFNYVGFELPNTAGDEMKNAKRDVPFGIVRGGLFTFFLYALPILGILLVLPVSQVTNFGGFVSAIKSVFTVYGGHLTKGGPVLTGAGSVLGDIGGIMFIIAVLTSGITWIMGSDRALAVSGYDGAAPRFLGVINSRFGTPVRVNIFSGVVATIVMILAHQLTSGSAAKYFSAVLSVTISTTLISYLGIFPALAVLRRKMPDVPRPYKAPMPVVITVVLTLFVAFATVQLIAPGLGDHWFGSAFIPSGWNANQKWTYLLTEGVPVLVFIAVGTLFWRLGKPTRNNLIPLVHREVDLGSTSAATSGQMATPTA